MFDDLDPEEFADTARSVTEACAEAGGTAARAVLLAEAGLLGVLAPERCGGLGLPMRFAIPVVRAAGAGLLAFPLIETLVLAKALSGIDPALAGALCVGETVATIAWAGTVEDGVVGCAPLARDATQALAMRADGSGVLIALNGVRVEDAPEFDLEAPEGTLRLTGPVAGIDLDAATVATLRAEADLLRTAFVHGSATRCLQLAADYAQERSQFGRLLSANQALRHRMSRDAVVIETLSNGLARALREPAEGAVLAREALWSWAASAGPSVAESAIQVFGGMGFTWDVPLHRHLRRMRTLACQGQAVETLDRIGDGVIAGSTNAWYEEIADVV